MGRGDEGADGGGRRLLLRRLVLPDHSAVHDPELLLHRAKLHSPNQRVDAAFDLGERGWLGEANHVGVGTHLVVRSLEVLGQLMARLEERYQASVDAGAAERRIADRMLMHGFKPRCPKLPFVWAKPPWRVV